MSIFSDQIDSKQLSVVKRSGSTTQEFSIQKIEQAIKAAYQEVGKSITEDQLNQLAKLVKAKAILMNRDSVTVEILQDLVETSLMEIGATDVAKAYILYRNKRSEIRESRLEPDPTAISDYIHPNKYARYLSEFMRRETFSESIDCLEAMHIRRFPHLSVEIKECFSYARVKKVLPSMRSLQFGGHAIECNHVRLYNCSFYLIDCIEAFKNTIYLLLCGTGTGYSIQFEHIEKLPALSYVDDKIVRHFTIPDSIEGWSDALHALMMSYVKGYYIEFNYSEIRDRGILLKTSGGRAPGHLGLKKSLETIRNILDNAQGRRLRPIECYDIVCMAADAVLSGGVRRSATIALFSLEDGEMMAAKTGNWFSKFPWRANSNNSVVLKRGEVPERQYKRIFQYIKEFGEPGFVFVENYNYGVNPCCEIGLNPVLTITEEVLDMIEAKRASGKYIPEVSLGDTFTGISFCNLTEVNAAAFNTKEDMVTAARMAARIGTLQASYTDFPYLGWVTEIIAEREALLGVSMTGIKDKPDIALNPENQKEAMAAAVEENRIFASKLGIRPAARVGTVKPAGSTSLLLGCTGSGIHDHHARRYIRRVVAKDIDPVFKYFQSINPHMTQLKPNGDWVVEFPVKAPEGATVKGDLSAIDFLKLVKLTQENWVIPGTARPDSSPGLTHNVSNTVTVAPDEWDSVAQYVWDNQQYFTGVSFLPSIADKLYAFAPNEKISTEADEEKWNNLIRHYTPVDYTKMIEEDDNTELKGEIACVGGACLV